ncbi:Membrane protein YdfJ [compost metagenome]
MSLGVLVLTFGSLSATLIPLLIGGSTLLLFNALVAVAHLPMNPVSRILSGLVGLGLAIDYTVFMVSRFKEEVRGDRPLAEAVRRTVAYPGRTVFFSALVMVVSIGALWLPDVSLSRTVVIDLLAVIGVSLVNTLVMGPVLLALKPDWLDKPRWLSRWIEARHAERFWRALAEAVVRHPKRSFTLALGMLLLLALPATRMKLWEPVMAIAPKDSESMRAYQLLERDGWGGELVPVDVIVQALPGKTIYEPETLAYLHDFTRAMERHPRVAAVRSLTSWNPAFDQGTYQAFYRIYGAAPWLAANAPFAPLVSRDGATATLVRIHPRDLMTLEDTQAILEAARQYARAHPERRVEVGGVVARVKDFTHELYRHLGAVLALVVGGVCLILAVYMRSVVLPLKAAVMNFLPILASLGVLTLLFQDGWLGGVLHTPHNGAVTNIVPLVLFCIVFGLSMDYEVLILSRITEAYERSKDLEAAVIEGLSRSGSLITGAALILLGVFATGIFSSSPQTQEICWGISVAILIDATIVRLLLVPSFMVLLGRWNWWMPGRSQGKSVDIAGLRGG